MPISNPEAAAGKWRGILSSFGVADHFLSGRHTGCPLCQSGKDRFRFDDKQRGMFYCNICGAGDGLTFLMKFKNWDFHTAAREVEKIVGTVETVEQKREQTDEEKRVAIRKLWKRSVAIQSGDVVDLYLRSRAISLTEFPKVIRRVGNTMLAKVDSPNGEGCTIHRTEIVNGQRGERKLMPGKIVKGSAIRLMPYTDTLGISEGLETALSASILHNVPVWSAINSSMLSAWIPPQDVRRVIIFSDRDAKYGGEQAAFSLAHRLSCDTKNPRLVEVALPDKVGQDFNDQLANKK